MTHLDWAVLYLGMRACYIRLRSGWGSDGNVYIVLRGLTDFWKPGGNTAGGCRNLVRSPSKLRRQMRHVLFTIDVDVNGRLCQGPLFVWRPWRSQGGDTKEHGCTRHVFCFAKRNLKCHERRAAACVWGHNATGCVFRDEGSSSVNTHTALARPRGSRGAHPAPMSPIGAQPARVRRPRASAGLAQPAAHPGALTASPAQAAAAGMRAPFERCAAPGPLRRRRGNGPAGAGGLPAPGAWLLSARWP